MRPGVCGQWGALLVLLGASAAPAQIKCNASFTYRAGDLQTTPASVTCPSLVNNTAYAWPTATLADKNFAYRPNTASVQPGQSVAYTVSAVNPRLIGANVSQTYTIDFGDAAPLTVTVTVVPYPGSLSNPNFAPIRLARCRMPSSPK